MLRISQLTVSSGASATRRTARRARSDAERHLHGARAANQLEDLVDEDRHHEDVERGPTSRSAGGARSVVSQSMTASAIGLTVADVPASVEPSGLPRISSATRTTCTISATACTRTMCAPPSTAAVTAAAVPQSRSRRRPVAERLAQERLARRPDQHRPVERRRELRQPRQHTITVRRPFGKPDARDRRSMRSRGDAGARPRRRCCSRSSAAHLARRRRRTRASAYIVFDRPRVCIRTSAAPRLGDDARQRGIVAQAADVVDDRRARRDRRARHVGLVGVDGDRHARGGPPALAAPAGRAPAPRRPRPASRPAASIRRRRR